MRSADGGATSPAVRPPRDAATDERRGRSRARAFARFLQIGWAFTAASRVYLRERIRLRGKGAESRQRAAGRALVRVANDLGATFIKIGQILSTRADILPRPLLEELARLQDQVPPFPFEQVRKTIESELGRSLEEVYDHFDPQSIAAGSVAQVHRAVLRTTGDTVAVKVRRPDIAERVRLDRAILLFVARLLERLVPSFRLASLEEAVGEFSRAVEGQLDFLRESSSIERVRENFRDDPDQIIPRPYPEASSLAVLTMEWVEGLREEQLGGSDIDMRHVVRAAVRSVCRATFVHGFLHADPHPGNVRFLAPGRIVTVDYGLMAELSDADRLDTARMLFGIVTTDGKAVAKILFDQAPRRDPKNYAAYEADMCEFVANLRPRGLGNIEVIVEIGRLFDILRRHRVQARSHLTMIYVALLSMEGLAKRLDPNLSVFDEMVPYLAEGLGMVPRAVDRTDSGVTAGKPAPESESRTQSFAGGRYQVLRLLGEGAKKRVYLARDEELGREVAVAALKTEGLDELKLARLRLEARAMARLGTHPGIVGVHDIGEDEGRPYVVTEYMAGGTLAEVLERRDGRKLPIHDAIPIAVQICEALEYAHERGIVHRDLKPANVWLSAEGFAKLGDFGLSTASDFLRESDAFVGTAQYMPPEQALGRPIGPRSDLYALGCMLYEMLTGAPPFSGVVAEVVAHHLQTPPMPPSSRNADVPKTLDALILRCLAKKPEDRPENAAEVARTLGEIIDSIGAEALTPTAIERIESGIFVGREQELEQLLTGLDDVARGRGRLFLLTGEPGIGKTRTAEELAMHARRRGLHVLFGRCHEGEGAPAFWPWVQILRAHAQDREPATLAAELGFGAGEVAQLLPELRERLPKIPVVAQQETEEARFRLFDAITTFLKNAAKLRPLVLVLDDLHWADKPSLLLLQFLAREIGEARLFILATYRDVDVLQGHPLAEVLPSLRRAHAHERIRLRGFEEAEVRSLLTALAGQNIPNAFVRAIHRETEGNPFFIEEMLSHLVEEGTIRQVGGRWVSDKPPEEMGLPEGVRDVIGRRIGRLSEPCRRALTMGSAIGREFEVAVLERMSDLERPALTEALGEAESARVIAEVPRALGRYRFTHALIRETLYGEIRTAQRVNLHRQIGSTLEELYAGDAIERHLAELAYHYAEAAVGGEVDKAVAYATRAGESAAAHLAFEEAMRCFEQAIQALELRQPIDEAQRCELMLRLGEARFATGEFERAKETFLRVAELAEQLRLPEAQARAALGYGGLGIYFFGITQPNDTLVGLLEKALVAYGPNESPYRARVMARLASLLIAPAAVERRRTLARDAIEMARRTGDTRGLAEVLNLASWALSGPADYAERGAAAEELTVLARELHDRTLEAMAQAATMLLGYESGRAEVRAESLTSGTELAERSRQSYIRWAMVVVRAAWATYTGQLDEAERLVGQALRMGQDSGLSDAMMVAATQLATIRALQGRAAEELGNWSAILRQYPAFGVGRYATLFLYAENGREEELRRMLDDLCGADFTDLPRDFFFLPVTVVLAESIWYAKDAKRAAALYDVLAPFAGRCVAGGPTFLGSISRYLALLASLLERYDVAERHFRETFATETRMGGVPFLARAQNQYAEMLHRRGRPGDREKALNLLSSAIETAEKVGMGRLVVEATKLRLEIQGVTGKPDRGSIDLVASSIDMRRPDLASHAAPDGTVTLLFSDVEDFTGMTERLGDRRAHEIIRDHNSIVRSAVKAHGGFEVELMGDGFLIAFDSARRGLECAIAIQQRFTAYNATHPEVPLRVRMGLHTGEAIREANKFFGRSVILAARIAAHARGGQILVSSLLRQLTESSGIFRFGNVVEVKLKGLAEQQAVCAVGWEGHEPEEVTGVSPRAIAPRVDGNVFRRNGDFWTITFEGRSISLRDAKGLNYLARLVGEPGREFHVLDLAGGGDAPAAVVAGTDATSANLGSAGELLDAQARAEYKNRIDELRAELEEADAANDPTRAALLREEIDFLSQELSAAFGLGGRARKAGDAAERARKAVAGRINDTISRIRKEHASLALHFSNAIRLGVFCEYQPEKTVSWQL